MNQPILEISDLGFGPPDKPILEHINLKLEAGHFLGVVGPNGAGKSTLLNLIAGILRPDSGHIHLFGECLKRFNRRKLQKRISYLHQLHEHELHLPIRVSEIVRMGLPGYTAPVWKSPGPEHAIREAMEMMDIQHLARQDFRMLSGGQRQRVRLAMALVRKPALLLLDEPSAALDSRHQESLFSLLRQLCDKEHMGIIMVEHDIAAISSYVDSVACLNRRIHYHAFKGEHIPEDVWKTMYGEHMHVMAHDTECIGCASPEKAHD